MEDKIKLLLEYMKKEKELTKEWDKEDGIDVNSADYKIDFLLTVDRIKSFIRYRNIRIEEAWFSKLHKGDISRKTIEKFYDYDDERVKRHSLALNSMIGLNEFGKKYGLPKFYEGELIRGSDIDNYANIAIRKKETDFFLQFIDKLGRTSNIVMEKYMEEMNIEKSDIEIGFIKELQSNVDVVDNKYGVEKNLIKDDGDIKFKDDETLSEWNR